MAQAETSVSVPVAVRADQVPGQHGTARHRGNMFAVDDRGELRLDLEAGANLSRLPAVVDPGKHLRPTSDIVALMVFEHHLTVHNALTRAMVQCRRMLHYQKSLQQDLSEEVSDEPRYTSTRNVFENSAQEVLDALLFKDEAAMPEGGVSGSADFQKENYPADIVPFCEPQDDGYPYLKYLNQVTFDVSTDRNCSKPPVRSLTL